MNRWVEDFARGLKNRRFKEAAAIAICVISAVGGWYDLRRGADYGLEAGAICAIWTLTYCWLSGRWLPFKLARHKTIFEIYREAKAARPPRQRDTSLERFISWGSTLFFAALLYWLFSAAN